MLNGLIILKAFRLVRIIKKKKSIPLSQLLLETKIVFCPNQILCLVLCESFEQILDEVADLT